MEKMNPMVQAFLSMRFSTKIGIGVASIIIGIGARLYGTKEFLLKPQQVGMIQAIGFSIGIVLILVATFEKIERSLMMRRDRIESEKRKPQTTV